MPDIQSELAKALAKTPIAPKSQSVRIWNWLKDHPEKSAKDIGIALNLGGPNVSSLLNKMAMRGMVIRRDSYNSYRHRVLAHYTVSPKLTAYEWLPLLKPIEKLVVDVEPPTQVIVTEKQESKLEKQESKLEKLVHSLTLGELRQLVKILRETVADLKV